MGWGRKKLAGHEETMCVVIISVSWQKDKIFADSDILMLKSLRANITSSHMMVPGHMMRKATNMLDVVTTELQKDEFLMLRLPKSEFSTKQLNLSWKYKHFLKSIWKNDRRNFGGTLQQKRTCLNLIWASAIISINVTLESALATRIWLSCVSENYQRFGENATRLLCNFLRLWMTTYTLPNSLVFICPFIWDIESSGTMVCWWHGNS